MIPLDLTEGELLDPIPDHFLLYEHWGRFRDWLRELHLPGDIAVHWLRRVGDYQGRELSRDDYAAGGLDPDVWMVR